MTPFETIEIDEMVVACAGGPGGGGGPLGHPRVYLNLAPAGRVECPYCSRLFVNPAVAQAGGVAVGLQPTGLSRGEVGVAMPSAHGVGQERPTESPTPRQIGEAAGDGDG